MPTPLPHDLLDLLRRPSPCFLATLMPDGSPQLTQTWVTTDGEHTRAAVGLVMAAGVLAATDPLSAST